jgi:hypothetical protein
MKGGINRYDYNQLGFLSKLYYNFMCLFDTTYCLERQTTKYWHRNKNFDDLWKRTSIKNLNQIAKRNGRIANEVLARGGKSTNRTLRKNN